MNSKTRRKARELYNRNRKHVESNKNLPWREIVAIAKQQDTLYLISVGEWKA